ncbi:MAG TPA: FkbM family methyltransferase [Actinomycetota bacterium]|nr:FkbM family methyltransferase [Actinomycetota bacterium]
MKDVTGLMISYANNREDVLLRRLFPDVTDGFYIDVGAGHPEAFSLTKHFYDEGWHGINVEPNKHLYAELVAERPRDLTLNAAVGNEAGSVTFYECEEDFWGYSSLSAEQAEIHRADGIQIEERQVEVTTLAAICEAHVKGEISFLSVDVEGFEKQVLEGADFRRWRPRVVIVEATQPNTDIPTHEGWEHLLLDADYLFAHFDGLNRYYLRREDEDLKRHFEVPVNVLERWAPYEYVKQRDLLLKEIRDHQRSNLASISLMESYRGTIDSLLADHQRLRDTAALLRQQYEELVRNGGPDPGVGPLGMAIARRLVRLGQRLPRTAQTARFVLRAGMAVRRRLGGSARQA